MKVCLLFALIALAVSEPLLGSCTMAPKKRPIECYEGKVLPEDIPELQQLLNEFKEDGDDHVFADYLGDMFDKKEFREGRETNEEGEKPLLGKCGVHPKYLPYECYEPQVLRRDRTQLKQAFDKLHESDLDLFNEVFDNLRERKIAYFLPKEE